MNKSVWDILLVILAILQGVSASGAYIGISRVLDRLKVAIISLRDRVPVKLLRGTPVPTVFNAVAVSIYTFTYMLVLWIVIYHCSESYICSSIRVKSIYITYTGIIMSSILYMLDMIQIINYTTNNMDILNIGEITGIDDYSSLIDKYIIAKKTRIRSIIQTYINNNTITDIKDFIGNDLKVKDLENGMARYFVVTRPTDIYFLYKCYNYKNKHLQEERMYRIRIIKNKGAHDALLPYPNYTIIKYKGGTTITIETYPYNININKPSIEDRTTIGRYTSNNIYYSTTESIINKVIDPAMTDLDEERILEEKKAHYYKDEYLYYWSVAYIIHKVIKDTVERKYRNNYEGELPKTYIVGSYVQLFRAVNNSDTDECGSTNKYNIKYDNEKQLGEVTGDKINDIDIIIYIDTDKNTIIDDLYNDIIKTVENIINIYSIKGILRLKAYYRHSPIIQDEYYSNDKEDIKQITYHIMITTKATYDDLSKLVKYHRGRYCLPLEEYECIFNNKNNTYTISQYIDDENGMGVRQMKESIIENKIRQARWIKEGNVYRYHSNTQDTAISRNLNKELYIVAKTESEKCRLYKYVIKWTIINLAYSTDASRKGLLQISIEDSKKIKTDLEIISIVLKEKMQGIKQIRRAISKYKREKIWEYYNKSCRSMTEQDNKEMQELLTKLLEVIELLM